MAKMKLEFVGALTKMAIKDGNEQAREWAEWFKKPRPAAIANVEEPGVIADFMAGRPPQYANPADERRALADLEYLQNLRRNDPRTFDAILGGVTQAEDLVEAYIDHANGRRYYRGWKREADLTDTERYCMRYPLSQAAMNRLRRTNRPIG